MIEITTYEMILGKYGHCSSWAVWSSEDQKPKSNIGDLSIFDINTNGAILQILNTDIVMVGLNISRRIENKFGNFHDSRPQSQDYKLRYAFNGTQLYGAYMTDIIKDFENVISGDVMKYLKLSPDFEKKNIELFIEELNDIGSKNTLILAFGNDPYTILKRNFKDAFQIIKVPHYSIHISKEEYRTKIIALTSNVMV